LTKKLEEASQGYLAVKLDRGEHDTCCIASWTMASAATQRSLH